MKKHIATPDEIIAQQDYIALPPGIKKEDFVFYPPIEFTESALEKILTPTREKKELRGIDLEFTENLKPTIVSVTTEDLIVTVPWSQRVAELLRGAVEKRCFSWVAHSGVSADKPVIDKACGINMSLEDLEDSMLTHYLNNQHLTKAPAKEESDDAGALGFMDLWTAASLVVDVPNWKQCRGRVCYGPCPTHKPLEYCGLDSWAGLKVYLSNIKDFKEKKINYNLYRELLELTHVCYLMEQNGVCVNVEYVKNFEKESEARKAALFPDNKPFNPRSPQAVIDWFKEQKFKLRKNDKKTVREALESLVKKEGYTLEELDEAENLSPILDALYKLDVYKTEGKGLDPWFGEKYLQGRFIHPRFITVGTSTGRLASSSPNCQNIPARGFGDFVRRAIIPRDSDLIILKADKKQLELRMCLYLAGVDVSKISDDAFSWLVEQSGDLFFKAAEFYDKAKYERDPKKAARDIAKRVSHASDYLEGFKLFDYEELGTRRIKTLIDAGALVVYSKKFKPELKKDWTFYGKVVGFTGVNLAQSLFNDTSFESRKKALWIQEQIYFQRFGVIRDWHRRLTEEIESKGAINTPTGRYVRLYGSPEDQAKAGAAVLGQGVSADHMQAVMLRYWREHRAVPLLQVHDELVFERPRGYSKQQHIAFLRLMTEETWRLPGFRAPIDMKIGENWKDLVPLDEED
jgi:DNA polymerase I-like protein with 3'-5' exonuclease and polymerase domains